MENIEMVGSGGIGTTSEVSLDSETNQSENEKEVQSDKVKDDSDDDNSKTLSNVYWTLKNWKGILLHTVTTLVFVTVPSYTDQWSDILLSYTYLAGADYTTNLDNLTEGIIQNCTHLYTTVITHPHLPSPISTVYTFTCHQTDPIYGIVTLTLTVLPGVWLAYKARYHYSSMWYKVCGLPLLTITFPLQLLFVKAAFIINPGMKEWLETYTIAETQCESAIQLCLQIFIVLSRADRQASYIQIFTILVAGGMVIKNTMAPFLAGETDNQKLNKFLTYFPMFMTTAIFRILSLVVISVLLRWNCVYFYAAVVGTTFLLRMLARKYWDMDFALFRYMDRECLTIGGSTTTSDKKESLSNMLLWSTVNSVSLTTLAILINNDDQLQTCMPDLYPIPLDCHTWAEMPLALNFNMLYGVCMGSGALSLTLFLIQVFWAEKRPGGELYKDDDE